MSCKLRAYIYEGVYTRNLVISLVFILVIKTGGNWIEKKSIIQQASLKLDYTNNIFILSSL